MERQEAMNDKMISVSAELQGPSGMREDSLPVMAPSRMTSSDSQGRQLVKRSNVRFTNSKKGGRGESPEPLSGRGDRSSGKPRLPRPALKDQRPFFKRGGGPCRV